MIHELKTLPQYFSEIKSGNKTFELRKNDRNFGLGDTLLLREWTKETYTGREEMKTITYILKDCPEYGLQDGFVILGLK